VKAQNNDTAGQSNAGANLPQTASPLPLLGLLGLGSIGAGLLSRKKK
jgi:LPXTG-motif cell wall-anchored protein